MKRSGFKMKGNPMKRNFGIVSPMKKDEVVKGEVVKGEVSGEKKKTFNEQNTRMTEEELRDAKINPKEGRTYYRNNKSGQISTTFSSK
tara:strand:- start:42 stop:305 length:264 start_codon:yes stop_codon:yes gene_type:complete